MMLVGKYNEFEVYFDTEHQVYRVMYKGKLLVERFRFRDVKSYLE